MWAQAAPSCRRAKMRCRRSARAAGERAERRVRGEGESEGESVMRYLSEMIKNTLTYFCLYENKNHRIFNLRQHSRSALAATPTGSRTGWDTAAKPWCPPREPAMKSARAGKTRPPQQGSCRELISTKQGINSTWQGKNSALIPPVTGWNHEFNLGYGQCRTKW